MVLPTARAKQRPTRDHVAEWFLLWSIASSGLLQSCGAVVTEPVASRAPAAIPLTVVTPEEALGVDELFARASRAQATGRLRSAAEGFDRVVAVDPHGPWGADALYRAGLVWEELGNLEQAAARFELFGSYLAGNSLASECWLRALRIRAHQGRWALANHAGTRLRGLEPELLPTLEASALGVEALAEMQAGDTERAERLVAEGQRLVEAAGLDRAGRLPRDLAMLYFARGELYRRRAQHARIGATPEDFLGPLERRCSLLLAAQSAYGDAMRAYDPHWSVLSAYQIASLYEGLHADLMQVQPPRRLADGQANLFRAAVALRYAVLLKKASGMLQHALRVAERENVEAPLAGAVQTAAQRVVQALGDVDKEVALSGYSAGELQAALDRLGVPE